MYKELSKEEKKEVRNLYKLTNKGHKMNNILNRLFVEGIVSLIIAIIITIAILFFDYTKWFFISVALLVIAGVIFLYAGNKIRVKEYNKFINSGYEKVKNKLTKNK